MIKHRHHELVAQENPTSFLAFVLIGQTFLLPVSKGCVPFLITSVNTTRDDSKSGFTHILKKTNACGGSDYEDSRLSTVQYHFFQLASLRCQIFAKLKRKRAHRKE